MPELNPISLAIWIIRFLAGIAVIASMLRYSLFKRWPSHFAYLIFLSLRTAALMAIWLPRWRGWDIDSRTFAYFYTYWFGQFALDAIQVFVLWQILSYLIYLRGKWRGYLAGGFLVLIAGSIAIGAELFAHTDTPFYFKIMRDAIFFQRTLSIAWCISFLAVVWSISAIGMYWDHHELSIASGFAFSVVVDMLCSLLLSDGNRGAISTYGDLFFLGTLAIWLYGFLRRPEQVDSSRLNELQTGLAQLEGIAAKLTHRGLQ